MRLLDNKVCVITGGAGSLGLESAKAFIQEGAKVMLIDRDENALKTAIENLEPSQVSFQVADVSRSEDVKAYVNETVKRFGKIDVIFSNAGNTGEISPITDLSEEIFDAVYSVHVKGAFLACKYGIPNMTDGGSIIITSSVAAFRGDPGAAAYITAKIAQVGLMRSVAKEVASRGIRVNTIHPGPIDNSFQKVIEDKIGTVMNTDGTEFFNNMIPLGRHASAEEVARSVLYLASDQSSFTTGTTLAVDGGLNI